MKQIIVFKLNQDNFVPKEVIQNAPQSGPFDQYAEHIMSRFEIVVSLADSIAYLSSVGAWDAKELLDLEANRARILWLAVVDLRENGDSFWYMGE